MWRGEPFIVLAEHEGWLRVEYTVAWPRWRGRSGWRSSSSASTRGWAPAAEVVDVREFRAQLVSS